MIYLKQYYNKYFLPYTDIPYEDVPATQRMELKESTSFAAYVIAHEFKEVLQEVSVALKLNKVVDKLSKAMEQ